MPIDRHIAATSDTILATLDHMPGVTPTDCLAALADALFRSAMQTIDNTAVGGALYWAAVVDRTAVTGDPNDRRHDARIRDMVAGHLAASAAYVLWQMNHQTTPADGFEAIHKDFAAETIQALARIAARQAFADADMRGHA